MNSAFGIDHGDFSKGLKPANMAALRTVRDGHWTEDLGLGFPIKVASTRASDPARKYAAAKTYLRGGSGGTEQKNYARKMLNNSTRTTRATRDANRKKAFGS